MTARLFRAVGPACLLLGLAACGGEEPEEQAAPPEPVIIESPRTRVLVGSDTVLVFAPTLFAYFGARPDVSAEAAARLAASQDFQMSIRGAQGALRDLGVRVEAVREVPTILDMTPAEDAAAGPSLAGLDFAYVFVDARGNVRRVTSLMASDQVLCTAAGTFGLTLDAQHGAACR